MFTSVRIHYSETDPSETTHNLEVSLSALIVFCVGEIKEKLYFIFHTRASVLYGNTVQWLANTAQWTVQRCQESN